MRAVRAARSVTPGFAARGWNTRPFDLVAQTERRRIASGEPTPQVRDSGAVGISLPSPQP